MTERGQALYLLFRTGLILGLMLATVNWARGAGWGSVSFTLAPVLLAGLGVGFWARWRAPEPWPLRFWGYSALSGALGMVIPNWLVFMTMAQDGVITAAVFYLLSPLFTQALSWLLGLERLAPLRILGLLVGAVGALVLVFAPLLDRQSGDLAIPFWGLLIPLSLALGNLYRKHYMPVNRSPAALAAGMLLAAGLLFAPLYLLALWQGWPGAAIGSPAPLVLQAVIMGLGFISYFQFLRRVDPVYFSQLGYLVTLTGGLAGVFLFGERPGWHHLSSLVLVIAGVWLVSQQGRRPSRPSFRR